MGDQTVARPPPSQDNTNTEKNQTYIYPIGIRTYDLSVRAAEDSTSLRQCAHYNQHPIQSRNNFSWM
jgi:hypothetical protein